VIDSGERRAGVTAAGRSHLVAHMEALLELERNQERLARWGRRLAAVLLGGGRLLACGNGGSAAEAEHLVAELVGRFDGERPALSAVALANDSCSLSAIANDYGWREGLARQVRAHGRPGDVLLALSTSGESLNVLEAVRAARGLRMSTWGLSGPRPNQLLSLCDDGIAVPAATPVAQEVHLVAIHLLCAAVDSAVAAHVSIPMPEPS
jgi:D-sedoheptulose 7-phosphate isomerase